MLNKESLKKKNLAKLQNAARRWQVISGSYVFDSIFMFSVRSKWQKNEKNNLLHYYGVRE